MFCTSMLCRILSYCNANLLSQWMMIGASCFSSMSLRSLLIHTTWQAAEVVEMYSASVLDKAVISYFLELHATAVDPRLKTHPDVLFWSSIEPPQSLSVKPGNFSSFVCSYISLRLVVPAKCRKRRFTAPKWYMEGWCMSLETKDTVH